ncbi:MAG: transcription antitermination factor NusB [Chitinophagaceae bacterium]|nr:transcription antitermination factor NusB [Oligoflexus sp.]
MTTQHPNAGSREWALQFLYQAEIEKLFFFSEIHFERFVHDRGVERRQVAYLRGLVEGVFEQLTELNEAIDECSEHWNLSRMPVIDRCILRLSTVELKKKDTPPKVIINEAIELAKKYSTENSGAFVNGILDKLSKKYS